MPILFHIFDFCIFICIFAFYKYLLISNLKIKIAIKIINYFAELWKKIYLKELTQR